MAKLSKKKKFLITVISVSLVFILAVTMCILYFTVGHGFNKYDPPPYDFSLFDKNTVLTDSQVQQDKNELVNRVENTHPYLAIKEVAGYEAAKQKFLNNEITTAGDMYFASAEYLAVFNDLHTSAIMAFSERIDLGISSYFDNDKLMMYPYGEENEAAELYAVNGILYKEIFSKYTSLENPNSIVQGIPRLFITDFLERAGIEWEKTLTLTYKNTDGSLFDAEHKIIDQPSANGNTQEVKNFEAEIKNGDILYIYARLMENDGSYSDCIDFIKNTVTNGIKKVIIDVTGNIGGSDGYGRGILDALGFSYCDMGLIVRYSDATSQYRGTWRNSGYKTTHPFKYSSKNKNNIELKVFCDEMTGSAAISGMVALCSYSDLGEIIGRMPGQNANFCGNAIIFQLTHSKVSYVLPLSYGYFERNGQKASNQLTVDTEVPATEDYMDFVKWIKK